MSKEIRLDRPGEEWRLRLHRHEYGENAVYGAELAHRTKALLAKTSIQRATFEYYASSEDTSGVYVEQNVERMIVDAVAEKLTDSPLVLAITGRSGSGKSTLAERVRQELEGNGISTALLSADDYNRGRSGLMEIFGHDSHTNWDAHYVYDTALLARHVEELKNGMSVPRFIFDFEISEQMVVTDEIVEPARVIIIEGIMANSPNIDSISDLNYVMPTPLATCIGRRAVRDLEDCRSGAVGSSVEEVLRYQLEVAEPEYQSRLTVPS